MKEIPWPTPAPAKHTWYPGAQGKGVTNSLKVSQELWAVTVTPGAGHSQLLTLRAATCPYLLSSPTLVLLTTFLPLCLGVSLHRTNGVLERDAKLLEGTGCYKSRRAYPPVYPGPVPRECVHHRKNTLGTFWQDLFLPVGAHCNESSWPGAASRN